MVDGRWLLTVTAGLGRGAGGDTGGEVEEERERRLDGGRRSGPSAESETRVR